MILFAILLLGAIVTGSAFLAGAATLWAVWAFIEWCQYD